jgi:6-pyruvoyltetrahydropterin/6-carboxytetrahydropterin synthase
MPKAGQERYRVRVAKEHLTFCAGHFISYEGNQCERLHGHNYRAAVEIEGPLDANYYVFDFIALKKLMRALTEPLDHRMLVAMHNPVIQVRHTEQSVELRYHDRLWVFPRNDCVLLPIENTTAELLARYLGEQLVDELKRQGHREPEIISIEVEENQGQSARWEWRRT